MRIFGIPVFGVILPFVGKRRIPLNRDGSIVDTGLDLIDDERGYYYVEPWTIEWLGLGVPISRSFIRLCSTGEIVEPPWATAG